jgi:predicted GH43/DUF377 family glycosyl hydrolase
MSSFVRGGLVFAAFLFCTYDTCASGQQLPDPNLFAGTSLSFNGSGQYASVTSRPALNVSSQFTLEAWVNVSWFTPNVFQMVVRKGDSYYVGFYGNNPYCRINTSPTPGSITWKTSWTTYALQPNTWCHLAMTYDSTKGGYEANSLDTFDSLKEYDPQVPIVPQGSAVDWDQHIREIGNVLYEPNYPDPNKVWKLFYTGYNGAYLEYNTSVGYAYSADGNNWTKFGPLDTRAGEDPYVVNFHGTYYLYCEDKAAIPFKNIRLYVSTDCENWTDMGVVFDTQTGGNPPNWQAQDVSSPCVRVEEDVNDVNNTKWYLLYEGRGGGNGGLIGLAHSANGINWVRDSNDPVMAVGAPGTWDESYIVPDDILRIDGTYYFTYHGYGASGHTGFWGGLATSTDLHNWKRFVFNPISTEGTAGAETDTIMFFPNGRYSMVYFARGGIRKFRIWNICTPHIYINAVEGSYRLRDYCNNALICGDSKALAFGKAPEGTQYPFEGMIDDVRLWNRALSPSEIRTTWKNPLEGNEPNLVAYWKFNEGWGQIAHDSSINHFDAYLGYDPCDADWADPEWVLPIVDWEQINYRDFNHDGRVDFGDLAVLFGNWLGEVAPGAGGDFTGDGIVNFEDFSVFATRWLWTAP